MACYRVIVYALHAKDLLCILLAVETIHGCGVVAESHVSDAYPYALAPFSKEVTSFLKIMQLLYWWSKDFSVAGVAEGVDACPKSQSLTGSCDTGICASYLF